MKNFLPFITTFFIICSIPGFSTATAKETAKKKTSAKTSKHPAAPKNTEEKPKTLPPQPVTAPSNSQVAEAYNYALKLYAAQRFEDAKDTFKKIALVSNDSTMTANSLFYYSQCAFRTEDFNGCVKAANLLADKYPHSEAIRNGHLQKLCVFLIDQSASMVPNWDFMRFQERKDSDGNPVWKESVPPGTRIKRINFKLAFGMFRALKSIDPNGSQTAACSQKLQQMLSTPISLVWVDEKAPPKRFGHSGDFVSLFSLNEKKDFSKVICRRLFYDWESEKLHQFLEMHDDVRNLKQRFVAKTKTLPTDPEQAKLAKEDPTFVLTLSKLFQVSGYDPFEDSFRNVIESAPSSQM